MLSCPMCGSMEVRRSRVSSFSDRWQRMLAKFPWRCRICGLRFYLDRQSREPATSSVAVETEA